MSGERVLVAVDDSKCSHEAFQYALEKSKEDNYSKLTALTVVEGYPPEESSEEPDGEEIESAKELLKGYEEEAEKEGGELDTAVRKGSVASEIIVDFSESEEYDLIVIGSHGRTEEETAKLGSVSRSVAKNADCPVLVIT